MGEYPRPPSFPASSNGADAVWRGILYANLRALVRSACSSLRFELVHGVKGAE